MASFPTSVKSFTTKVDGVDNVQASHVNDLQAEVVAIETVYALNSARANNTVAQACSNGTHNIIDFATKDFDPGSRITTGASWKFTAGVAGKYLVSAMVSSAQTTEFIDGEPARLELYKNGSFYCYLDIQENHPATAHYIYLSGSTLISLAATDYIDIRVLQTSGVSINFGGAANSNHVSICIVAG